MRGVTALAAAALCAALLGAADGGAAPGQNVRLTGVVGPGFSITLRNAEGNIVTRLDPGTYDIVIDDRSNEHNFHLTGPGGVDRRTPIEGMGEENWTVTFVEGVYRYVCDPHRGIMKGSFTVGNPPPPTPPTATRPVTPNTRLVLTAGPRPVITLKTAAGKAVKTMKRGTYTMTVRDRSTLHNAHVRAPGYERKTTLAFVGSQTWKVKLARVGTLRFLCDPHAAAGMRGSARIVR